MNVEKTFNYTFIQCLCPGINEGIKLQVMNHKNVTKQRLSIFFCRLLYRNQRIQIFQYLTYISQRKPQQLENSSFIIELQFSIHKTTRSFKCITEKYNKSARLENYFIFRMCQLLPAILWKNKCKLSCLYEQVDLTIFSLKTRKIVIPLRLQFTRENFSLFKKTWENLMKILIFKNKYKANFRFIELDINLERRLSRA